MYIFERLSFTDEEYSCHTSFMHWRKQRLKQILSYSVDSTKEHRASTIFWATRQSSCLFPFLPCIVSKSVLAYTHSSLSLWVPLHCLFGEVFRDLAQNVTYPAPFPLSYFLANRQLIWSLRSFLAIWFVLYIMEANVNKGPEFVCGCFWQPLEEIRAINFTNVFLCRTYRSRLSDYIG